MTFDEAAEPAAAPSPVVEEEAEALLSDRRLSKKDVIEECRLALKVSRTVARKAFLDAVPVNRQNAPGRPKKV
jgi:hypothetical protein